VTEPLLEDPVVTVDTGNRWAELQLDASGTERSARRWAYSYVATGREAQGPRELRADLLDLSRTAAPAQAAGVLTLDFDGPVVESVSLSVEPPWAAGVDVTVLLRVNEPLDGPPVVVMAASAPDPGPPVAAWTLVDMPTPTSYRLRHRVQDLDGEGTRRLWVSCRDVAGNDSGWTDVGTVTVDLSPPSVAEDPPVAVIPPVVAVGRTLTVEVHVEEDVRPGAVLRGVSAGGAALAFDLLPNQSTARQLVYFHVPVPGEDGTYDLLLAGLRDVAGNLAPETPVGRATVDGTPPLLATTVSSTSWPGSPTRVGSGGTLVLDVTTEPDAVVAASLPGLHAPGCVPVPDSPPLTHRCTWSPQPGEPTDGAETLTSVVVTATDAVGNTASASANVVVDLKPPEVGTALVRYEPSATNPLRQVWAARRCTRVSLTLIPDEVVDPSSARAWVDLPGGDDVELSRQVTAGTGLGLDFAWTWPTTGGETAGCDDTQPEQPLPNGTFPVVVTLTDVVGNVANRRAVDGTHVVLRDTGTPRDSSLTLRVVQEGVLFVRSPWGNPAPETLTGQDGASFTLPAGTYQELAPGDALSPQDTLGDVFGLEAGRPLLQVRAYARPETFRPGEFHPEDQTLLGTLAPRDGWCTASCAWPRRQARLSNVDARGVVLTGVDEAGNESRPVAVLRSQWVATSRTGASLANPHTLDATVRADDLLRSANLQRAARETSDDGVHQRVTVRGALAWQTMPTGASDVPPSADHAATYDVARQRLVLAGGNLGRDTWEWDGRNWEAKSAVASPQPVKSAMAYDTWRGRTWLFDDVDRTPNASRVWEWDGAAWWERTPVGTARPPSRSAAVTGHDPTTGTTYLLGGTDLLASPVAIFFGDLWAWDGNGWTAIHQPPGPAPGPRAYAAGGWDVARGVLVVHGGMRINMGTLSLDYLDDTWEWDGTRWWLRDTTPRPSPRSGAASAYDVARGVLVVAGGCRRYGFDGPNFTQPRCDDLVSDVWEWDGAAWQRPWAGDGSETWGPRARSSGVMVYDRARRSPVLVGGMKNLLSDLYNDAWAWEGRTWDGAAWTGPGWVSLPSAVLQPPPRTKPGTAWDPVRRRLVLFGGNIPGQDLSDLWEWDGRVWTQPVAPVTRPGNRRRLSATYAPDVDAVVFYGGVHDNTDLDEMWEWRGPRRVAGTLVQGRWTQRTPTPRPSARNWEGLAYDRARARLVLFGGLQGNTTPLDDTWEARWDAGASQWVWEERHPATRPSARNSPAMGYDAPSSRVVMYGGGMSPDNPVGDDLWTWDGTNWTEVHPPPGNAVPIPTLASDLVCTASRSTCFHFGGLTSAGLTSAALWEVHVPTGAWREHTGSPRSPRGRLGMSLVFDDVSSTLFMHGGYSPDPNPDTWSVDVSEDQRPAVQFTVEGQGAGFGSADVVGLVVRARAAGWVPDQAAVQRDGVVLLGFGASASGSPWVVLAQDGAGPGPSPLPWVTWTAANRAEALRLVRAAGMGMAFQVRPLAGSDPRGREPEVLLDHVEVRVTYNLPATDG
jgi:hypothetical protein